jgi:hypothetical protein
MIGAAIGHHGVGHVVTTGVPSAARQVVRSAER